MKKAEYMEQFAGKIFEGVICSITNWGFYVELPNTIEGMVHVTSLYDDRYYYREETYDMAGADTGKVYKLGQKVKVRVLGADKESGTVDFEIAEEGEE